MREAEVRGVIHYCFHHARAVRAVHLQLDAGKLFFVFGENLRQNVNARGFIGRDDQLAAWIELELVDLILRATPQIQNLLGIAGEHFSRSGQ